jgi:hypothetical protein
MKQNRTCVTLQETLNEIKLIGKEIEISQIDRTISSHGDTKDKKKPKMSPSKEFLTSKVNSSRFTRILTGSVMNLFVISNISCGRVADTNTTCIPHQITSDYLHG